MSRVSSLTVCAALLADGLALAFWETSPAAVDPIQFELAKAPGLDFTSNSGATARKYQPQTMLAGVALLDYDNDGLLDIYFVNGATMPGLAKDDKTYFNRLFRNNGDGTFTDVTARAGVQGRGYNIGVAVADYDNDGYEDLFVAAVRGNILYHNNGNGTFAEVTREAGLDRPDPLYGRLWATSAAWIDYDRDGWLDLFVSNYVVWNPDKEPICELDHVPDFCHPKLYHGLPNSLFRNNHDGTFTDVSETSGIRKSIGKGMGVAVADFDSDGWPDIFVANDTEPNELFHNNGNGTFSAVAVESGVAYTENGTAAAGMGADARDIDNDSWPDLFETALVKETMPLFRNTGRGLFQEITRESGVTAATLTKGGWGNGVFDLNDDGWKDLFVAASHVLEARGTRRASVEQSNMVLANLRNGKFSDVSARAGADFGRPAVHRGAAFGDLDNDGRIDVVVTCLNAKPEIWHNASPALNHWLLIKTVGSKSNRDGIGAKLKLTTASGVQYNHVTTAVGFA
ncbi:MAG: hypothetical protein DMG57_10960, partial [Acidobacteria bacterium]